MSIPTVLWWVRRDFRLGDNPALVAAAAAGDVLPVFVLDDALWGPAGAPRRAFLVGSLHVLHDATDGALVVRHGDPVIEIPRLAVSVGASAVFSAVDFGPYGRQRDEAVESALDGAGVEWRPIGSHYAVGPGAVVKVDGTPFKVFTPFSRAWTAHGWELPVPRPQVRWSTWHADTGAIPAAPKVDAELPEPGEDAALAQWAAFRDSALSGYAEGRNRPDREHTSRLSVYLKYGSIHPRTILAELEGRSVDHVAFRTELCWREFYADVLWHAPGSARAALNHSMSGMQTDTGEVADAHFEAWTRGRTGFPVVDAGMRQLLAQGWMHNRLRMITASFLVKDLHIDWTRGARWFMRHLVDGDLASNNHGWQWVAGTGTDAAPYFRVFNPVTQGQKFDPSGDYVRQFVPELRGVAGKAVHEPWDAPGGLAEGYPERIVEHKEEREEALRRYAAVRS